MTPLDKEGGYSWVRHKEGKTAEPVRGIHEGAKQRILARLVPSAGVSSIMFFLLFAVLQQVDSFRIYESFGAQKEKK